VVTGSPFKVERQTEMSADVDAVTAREQAWVEALLAGDIAALESLLSPRFLLVGVRSTGTEPIGRDAWFATLSAMRFHAMALDRVEVSLFGGCAVASVNGEWTVDFHGRRIDERFLLTDVWAREAGEWRVVRRHSSPYAKNPSASA
jgi:ketosteroid isomerase-like protein